MTASNKRRIEIPYRGHLIVGVVLKGVPTAAVFQGAAKAFDVTAATIDDAVTEAKRRLDGQLSAARSGRREPHVGTKDEYLRAFRSLGIAPHHAAMLRAHAAAPNQTMTAGELAKAAGYDSYSSANAHYGLLGRQVAEFLELSVPISETRRKPVWTRALADGIDVEISDELWHWRMHPEVFAALRDLNSA